MTPTKFYQALDPKIRGSQNLHDLFQQSPDELDFFVMLSSLGGLLGNASQCNYAAGNTFQDALAHRRASLGLPALSINVGLVINVGWVAQNQDVASRAIGIFASAREITVKDLTNLIEHHVRAGKTGPSRPASQVAVGIEGYPTSDARFLHIGASLADGSQVLESQDQKLSIESQVAAAGNDGARLLSVVLEAFKQKLGFLLAMKAEDVSEDDTIAGHGSYFSCPLCLCLSHSGAPKHCLDTPVLPAESIVLIWRDTTGVDSLVAVEIRNWIRKELGANVTVFEILNGKTSVKGVVEGIVKEKVKA